MHTLFMCTTCDDPGFGWILSGINTSFVLNVRFTLKTVGSHVEKLIWVPLDKQAHLYTQRPNGDYFNTFSS